jgi:hypothetical protein
MAPHFDTELEWVVEQHPQSFDIVTGLVLVDTSASQYFGQPG